jgi:hypothetical protein
MRKNLDNLAIGIAVGLLAPIVGLFFYYAFTYRSQTSFNGFLEYFKSIHIFVASISLCVYFSNLPVFFLFLWKENNKSARGVLFATIGYTIWVMYQKFYL